MRPRYFWPLVLIVLGVLLLLDNLGLLPGSAWGYIWPSLLILLGLSLLLARRGSLETVEDSTPLDGAGSAAVTFRHGAGELTVRGGAPPEQAYVGQFGGGVDKRVSRAGDRLDVTLQARSDDWWRWMGPWNFSRGLEWNVQLNSAVPLALVFETGASKSVIDLSELRATDVSVRTGASDTRLTMPARAGYTRAGITSGAASVNVVVPEGVAARISGTMGVGAFDVDQRRFPRSGGGYASPDFETAANRLELKVEGGVGSVRVS
jgi:hypothetical protein